MLTASERKLLAEDTEREKNYLFFLVVEKNVKNT